MNKKSLVCSYVLQPDGQVVGDGYQELQEALDEGFYVKGCNCTPMSGAGSGPSPVAVSVIVQDSFEIEPAFDA